MNENDLLRSMEKTYFDTDIPGDLLSKVQDAISEAKSESAEKIIMMDSRVAKKPDASSIKNNTGTPKDPDNVIVSDKDLNNLITIKKNNGRKKSNKKYAWLSAAAALALFIILPNTNAEVAHAMESVPVLGSVVKVITVHEYKDDQGNVSADIKTPEVETDTGTTTKSSSTDTEAMGNTAGTSSDAVNSLNSKVKKYTDEIIAQYKNDMKSQGTDGHENIASDYTVATDNDRLFALRFDTSVTMADSGQTVKIYDVDKQTGKILTLQDMFTKNSDYASVLKEEILKQMQADTAANSDHVYFATDEDPDMNSMVDMDDEIANSDFYVNSNGNLVIVFDKGAVAPMYMGVCEFTIGNDVIKDIANSDYL